MAYTDFIPLPRGISPLRSDCRPHSGRNDIIKQGRTVRNGFATFNQNDIINQTNTLSFRAKSRNPPRKKRHATHPRQPTRPQGLPTEKSPVVETRTIVHAYYKHLPAVPHRLASGGSPQRNPPRQKRNSRIRYAAGRGRPSPPTASLRIGHVVISSVAEKSPAIETARRVHAPAKCPQGLPAAVAYRLACAGSAPRAKF